MRHASAAVLEPAVAEPAVIDECVLRVLWRRVHTTHVLLESCRRRELLLTLHAVEHHVTVALSSATTEN